MICLKCDHRRNKTSSVPADNSTQDGHYSAVSLTLHTPEITQHGYSIKQSKCINADIWKVSEDEITGSDNLPPRTENCLVSRSPITRELNNLSRKSFHDNERRTKDGTKSSWAKPVSNINRAIEVDETGMDCSESADEGYLSCWFGLRKKV